MTVNKVRRNQVFASAGVLPYMENGAVVWKLKKWGNLKTFIGTKVPMVDGHPKSKVIAGDTVVYGAAILKACPKNNSVLCADVALDDNAPKRDGYSIGYVYDEYAEDGVFEGQPYSRVQDLTGIDHSALTDFPRNQTALATDELENIGECYEVTKDPLQSVEGDENHVIKYLVAYDSIITFSDTQGDMKMTKLTIEELNAIIVKQKNDGDELRAEISAMKAAGDARDVIAEKDKKIAELTASNKILGDSNVAYKAKLDTIQNDKMGEAVKLLEANGVTGDELDGKSWAYIQGRVDGLSSAAPDVSRTAVEQRGGDEIFGEDSTENYKYDRKTGEFVPKGGV